MRVMNCEAFQRGWEEELRKEDSFNPDAELLAHLDNCEVCRKWEDALFAKYVAALGVSLKDLGEQLQEVQDELEAAKFNKEPKS